MKTSEIDVSELIRIGASEDISTLWLQHIQLYIQSQFLPEQEVTDEEILCEIKKANYD